MKKGLNIAWKGALKCLAAVCIGFMGLPAASEPGERDFNYTDMQVHRLESKATGHEYELLISLPASYQPDAETHYPVVYLLDAYWDLPLVKSLYDKMWFDQHIPELILVGISYTGSQSLYPEKRIDDFTPVRDELFGRGGKAPQFLSFLKDTALPFIEQRYRVNTQDRALMGSSLGGLFTLYTFYKEPKLFSRYLASTPSANWAQGVLFDLDRQFAASPTNTEARVFMLYSSGEYQPYHAASAKYAAVLESRDYPRVDKRIVKVDQVRHATVSAVAYLEGLLWLYRDSAPDAASGFEAMQEQVRSQK